MHGLKIWPKRGEVLCEGVKGTFTGKSLRIIRECIENDSWVKEYKGAHKGDLDSDVKDLNSPWEDERSPWKIARQRENKIILGKEPRKPRKQGNSPKTSPKSPQ
jgi:hypothetical protein